VPPIPPRLRDRAIAELVRARGWVPDETIDREIDSAPEGELEGRLLRSGLLTGAQIASLREAVDGTAGDGGETIAAGSSDVTLPSAPESTVAARTLAGATEPRRADDAKAPGAVAHYRILRELGRGGMGVVYRALDTQLGREIALKVMRAGAEATETDVARFRREAAVLAKIGRHPHLVQVHDVGREDGRLYFTMDFIDGCSAKERLVSEGAFPARDAARIAAEVANALAAAHRTGVLHRDVKPHNILLDRAGTACLGDFGLAKASGEGALTLTGEMMGTPAYMSPEQALHGVTRATETSDVYSLGATLYELATGRMPFEGPSPAEIMRRIPVEEPVAPRRIRPDLHPDVETIALQAMRKDPLRRYASAVAMEDDLRRFLNGEPIEARPAGAGERAGAWLRRRRGLAAAGVLSAAAVAAAWAYGGGQKRTSEDRSAAEQKEADARRQRADGLVEEARSILGRFEEAERQGLAGERSEAARAARLLHEAAGLHPRDADIRYELGRALRRAGLEDDALAELERAVAEDEGHAMAWYEHGAILRDRIFRGRGTLSRRVERYSQFAIGRDRPTLIALAVAPRGEELAGEAALREQAARDFRKIAATGTARGRAAYGRGLVAYLEGDLPRAENELTHALTEDPLLVEALEARAEVVELKTRDAGGALADRKRVTELHPGRAAAAMDYALSLLATERFPEALAETRRAVSLAPGDVAILKAAMEVCRGAKSREDGLRYAEEALKHAEAHPDVVPFVFRLYGDLKESKLRHQLMVNQTPKLPRDLRLWLQAEYEFLYRRFRKALSYARAISKTSEVYGSAAHDLAHLEWTAGNFEVGLVAADDAVRAGLRHDSLMIRGMLRRERGDFDGAVRDFEDMTRAVPDHALALVHLAGARFMQDDVDRTIHALRRAIASTPLPDAQREFANRMGEDLAKRARLAKTAKERAGIVEGVGGWLFLLRSQIPDPEMRPWIEEGLAAVYKLLQMYYFHHGMYAEAISSGERFLAYGRMGAVEALQAAALAHEKRYDDAVQSLRSAMEDGFDDGAWLDADPVFEEVRKRADFVTLRKQCRGN
jgi:tetratricopeptide (TPR) repeat protein